LKVVYSRACESRKVWVKVRKLKFHDPLTEHEKCGNVKKYYIVRFIK